ncbi:hypothetical protein AAFF_G00310500 [Aldrovandia affinis]|uniref:Fibronectin type-III domain-containing protein n=1 Tax=Aldrovandia affinis TaxID=143900 RepID=A0AAD7R7N4_9TELE|nr:hypothetical protein AAFF_G00310500 [Aldrovandia affinis]
MNVLDHLIVPPSSEKMLLSWALCVSALLLTPASGTTLCTVQNGAANTNTQYKSSLLESLECHNDYKSHIRCQWTESKHAPQSLYHWNKWKSDSLCLPYGRPVELSDGRLTVHCQYNTTLFAIGIHDAFFFKTSCPPPLSKTVNPLQHVRVGPPRNLAQRAMEGGGRVLNWQEPHSRPNSSLNYQVSYRRLGQDWMEVEVSELELKIEALVPGCEYEAKVKAREDKGRWSEWSSLVVWHTEDAPGPTNLQCVFDGESEMTCSWELKRELAQVITYSLSYHTNQTSRAQRCSVRAPLSTDSRDPVLKFSCSFSISDPEQQVLVELIPTYNTKVIQSSRNIRPSCPEPLSVTERGQDWVLSWTPAESFKHIFYQVRYWSGEKQENAEYYNFTEGGHSYHIRAGSLLPSMCYTAQVRAQVIHGNDYSGDPSEWTQPVEWTTHPAPWSIATAIYIFISVLVAVFFLTLYLTLPGCRRRIVLWKVSVPSPLKSKVLEELTMRSPCIWPVLQKEMEKTSNVQVLDNVHLSCFLEDCRYPLALVNADYNGPCPHMSTQGWESVNKPDELSLPGSLMESQAKEAGLSFTGPYFLCPTWSLSQGSEADEQPGVEDSLDASSSSSSSSTTQLLPSSLCQSNMEYVGLPDPQVGPAQDSSQEHPLAWDEYVANSSVLFRDLQAKSAPESPDCDPPAYTLSPLPFQAALLGGVPGSCLLPGPREPGDWDTAFPPSAVPGCPTMGKGEARPGGQWKITDYVRLPQPF